MWIQGQTPQIRNSDRNNQNRSPREEAWEFLTMVCLHVQLKGCCRLCSRVWPPGTWGSWPCKRSEVRGQRWPGEPAGTVDSGLMIKIWNLSSLDKSLLGNDIPGPLTGYWVTQRHVPWCCRHPPGISSSSVQGRIWKTLCCPPGAPAHPLPLPGLHQGWRLPLAPATSPQP